MIAVFGVDAIEVGWEIQNCDCEHHECMGGVEVQIHSFLTWALCGGR